MKYTIQLKINLKNLNQSTWIILIIGCFLTLLFMPACNNKTDANLPTTTNNGKDPDQGAFNCKATPDQLIYGRTTFDMTYNQQGNPVKFTSTKAVSVKQPLSTVSTAYTIQYDSQGKISKISKMTDLNPDGYYVPEYNSNGQMIKLGEFDIQGQRNLLSTADFDIDGNISKITTRIEGDASAQVCNYTYEAGNLVKKAIQHFYDPVSKEFIDADFVYDYYMDKIKKDKFWFTGLLGLRIMADFADSKSIFYIPTAERGQLLFAQEGTKNKNILKHIRATAHRYNTTDDTNVDYTYNYDTDGTVDRQKADSRNVIIRSEPSPFGGTVNVTIPGNFSNEITIEYTCR
jgi:hypothetical protein